MDYINFLKEHISLYQAEELQPNNTYIIRLILTHQCNLHCTYCYEKYKNNMTMSAQTALETLDAEINKISEQSYSFLYISLFGGEPLLCFDVIQAITEYMETINLTIPYRISIVTNGTLLTDEQKNWFIAHKTQVELSLSIDGDKATHNKYREQSFDNIDLEFFRQNYPNSFLNMVIMPDTLKDLKHNIMFLSKYHTPINCSFAIGQSFTNEADLNQLQSDLHDLIADYFSAVRHSLPNLLDPMQLVNLVAPIKCYYTCHFPTYDCDGTVYYCDNNLPFIIGEETFDTPLPIKHTDIPEQCQKCKLAPGCLGCIPIQYLQTLQPHHIDTTNCQLKKLLYHELAILAIDLEDKGLLHVYNDGLRRQILEGALIVLENEEQTNES